MASKMYNEESITGSEEIERRFEDRRSIRIVLLVNYIVRIDRTARPR